MGERPKKQSFMFLSILIMANHSTTSAKHAYIYMYHILLFTSLLFLYSLCEISRGIFAVLLEKYRTAKRGDNGKGY